MHVEVLYAGSPLPPAFFLYRSTPEAAFLDREYPASSRTGLSATPTSGWRVPRH